MAHKKWKDIRGSFSPDAEERIRTDKNFILLEMNLRELREHVSDLNQSEVGALLEVSQAAVSQLERRQDAAVSSIAKFVATLGGRLELHAVFPADPDQATQQVIRISQFEDIKNQIQGEVRDLVPASKR